jgi:hypothetical protein
MTLDLAVRDLFWARGSACGESCTEIARGSNMPLAGIEPISNADCACWGHNKISIGGF